MARFFFHVFYLLVALVGACTAAPVVEFGLGILVRSIKENVAGLPLVREIQDWSFAPDEGLQRREQFQQLHGPRGAWLIERLGQGEGGLPKTYEGAPLKNRSKS